MGSDKERSALANARFLRSARGLKDRASDLKTEGPLLWGVLIGFYVR